MTGPATTGSFAVRTAHSIQRSVENLGLHCEVSVDFCCGTDLRKQLEHRTACLVVGIYLETRKDLAGDHFFARTSDEPVIQKHRRALVIDAPDADFFFPERGLKVRPVLAIRFLDIRALLNEALEDEILD